MRRRSLETFERVASPASLKPFALYAAALACLVYGVRVVPYHPDLATKYELGLVRWA